jgi:hypothetical protein
MKSNIEEMMAENIPETMKNANPNPRSNDSLN